MKIYKIFTLLTFASVALVSCEKALDKRDLSNADADLIFNDSTLTQFNLDYLYDSNLPAWFGNTGGSLGNVSSLSEETYADNKYFRGTLTNSDVADIGTSPNVNSNYGKIRYLNTFLRDVNAGSLPTHTKNKFKAQALFFRAFRYFDLVRLYGGVPLVLEPINSVGSSSDEGFLPRNKTSECIKQIVADLDSAIKYLPTKWAQSADWGRITSGAAAAFKGRVLLTYASPQFNPDNTQQRWQDAYDASTQAVTLLTQGGFGLNASYDQMWFSEVNNKEAVLVTGYNDVTSGDAQKRNGYDNDTRPRYLGTGSGSNQPTWEIVKAYPMKDGRKPGDPASVYTYNEQNFYKNRDPRFDKTIAYNGASWPIIGNSAYKLWTYYVNGKTVEPNATNTGFYLRKAINPSVGVSNAQYSGTDWMEIRYAEVLLNQAEAAAELGRLAVGQEAYDNLLAIRKRATIEAGADGRYGLDAVINGDKQKMVDAIMYEREIELAFEGKRFWDLRRRKLFATTLNGTVRTGKQINLKAGAPASLSTSPYTGRDALDLDNTYNTYFTIVTKPIETGYTINWKDEYYFFGMPNGTISNNPNIQQNIGWGGDFDPLQ